MLQVNCTEDLKAVRGRVLTRFDVNRPGYVYSSFVPNLCAKLARVGRVELFFIFSIIRCRGMVWFSKLSMLPG